MGTNDCLHSMEPPKFIAGHFLFHHTRSNDIACMLSNAKTIFRRFEKVVGVVGFMDRRLDLPEGLDPQVASVIHDCWQRYTSLLFFHHLILLHVCH